MGDSQRCPLAQADRVRPTHSRAGLASTNFSFPEDAHPGRGLSICSCGTEEIDGHSLGVMRGAARGLMLSVVHCAPCYGHRESAMGKGSGAWRKGMLDQRPASQPRGDTQMQVAHEESFCWLLDQQQVVLQGSGRSIRRPELVQRGGGICTQNERVLTLMRPSRSSGRRAQLQSAL